MPAATGVPAGTGPAVAAALPGAPADAETRLFAAETGGAGPAGTTVLGGAGDTPLTGAEAQGWRAPGATIGATVAVPSAAPVTPPNGPGTDQFPTSGQPSYHRNGRITGFVVLALVVVGALVAGGLLLTSGSSRHHPTSTKGKLTAKGSVIPITAVSVYMDNDRPPDDPDGTIYTYDGNPSTAWSTDQYKSPTFGNLYDGIGLEISLKSPANLAELSVTSPTDGWSASAYVSSVPITSGQSVAAWGRATSSLADIDGDATFSLGGQRGGYVLLWITNLGPTDQASVAELSVSS